VLGAIVCLRPRAGPAGERSTSTRPCRTTVEGSV